MAAKASNIVFSESIEIEDIDKEGKKFDRVSRLYAKGRNLGVDITLDYNFELYPLKVGQELTLALASSLSTTGGPATGDAEEEEKERPVWRPDGKGRGGLEKEYDYVMYGKVYKFDSGEKSIV